MRSKDHAWSLDVISAGARSVAFAFSGICFPPTPCLRPRARHWACFIVNMLTAQLEERWKVGVIGAGVVTSGSHLPVLVNMPDVSVEWLCDRSLATAQRVAKSYDIPRVFADVRHCPDVDVVLVATPVGSRREIVPEALSRGWHAFCEKPFALTVADHESYVGDARTRGLQIGVAQVRRYARPTASARALIQHDVVGPSERG